MENDIASITIGTAGHIDHGKSSLVKRLSGVDPDRFKEEQERGMTIDVGYACYTTRKGLKLGIIDVPGHEKFVKNMVTGASSVDLVVLVVAADDGVMPQTREHMEIMEVLGIEKGLVALTKIDLIDAEMLELAVEDVNDYLAGTFLEGCPVIPLSSATGEGIDRFTEHLEALAEGVEHRNRSGLFRMPVQRVFSAKGFGTVVTGVPVSGKIRVGDTLEVQPQGFKGRVRGLQAFDQARQEGQAGHRIAVNLSDVDYRSIERGCTLCTPDFFSPTPFFEGHFLCFDSIPFPIKNMMEVKVYLGCAEEMGRVVLLDRPILKPGEKGYIQIRLENPLVAVPDDRFLLRRHSPPMSLGGGLVINPSKKKARRFKDQTLMPIKERYKRLQDDAAGLIVFEMENWDKGFFSCRDIAMALGQQEAIIGEAIKARVAAGEVLDQGRGYFIHRVRLQALSQRVEESLEQLHRQYPLKPYLDVTRLRNQLPMEGQDLQGLLKMIEAEGQIEIARGGRIRKQGHEVRLSEAQQGLAEEIVRLIVTGGFKPPTRGELAGQLKEAPEVLEDLTDYLIATGALIRIGDLCFARETVEKLKEIVTRCSQETGEVKLPQVREAADTTRKFLIPLMEYLDSQGLTRREGDKRFLVQSS